MAKKYHWIKIEEEFFRQKEIKSLRKQERGNVYVIIYLKLMAFSLKYNNRFYFDEVEESFEEEISLILDEEVEDIKATLEFLKKFNLIEWIHDDEFFLPQVDELTGSECDSAERVRKHRKKKKEEEDNNHGTSQKILCNKNVTPDIELEKEKEKELDKDKDVDKDRPIDTHRALEKNKKSKDLVCVSKSVDENLKQISRIYEENLGPLYPAHRQWFIDISEKIQWNLFEKAVNICIDKSNVTPSYLKGIIKRWIEEKIYTLEDYNAKKIEFTNRKNMSKRKEPPTNLKNEEMDKDMLEEIKLLELKLGVS